MTNKHVSRLIAGLLSLGLGLGIAATSTVSFAAGKYTKKESDITATQTSLTKPAQKKVEGKDRPTVTADDIFGGVGDKVKSVTDAQISVLKRLIDNTADNDPEKPELLYRMAELYAEQEHYYNFRARDLDQKIFEAQAQKNVALEQKLKSDQQKYQKAEHDWLLGAVKQYIAVADHPEKYASYKKMDEVLFYLAYLLTQVKKEEAARTYFKRLIKDYPQSKFLPDAFLSFAEYYFENKDLEAALKFYEKVMQYPDSRVYTYARYKEGWVYYNMGDFKQSLATFVDVIHLSQKSSKKGKIGLEKEAKKDSVRAYSRVGTPDKAWAFFKNIGGDYATTMLEQLGELYNGQGQFQDSIKIYRQLIALEPKSPKVCSWQTEVMHNTLSYTGSKAHPDNVKELQRLADVYDSYKSNKGIKASDLEECKDNTANTLRELATVWHKEAQKTNDQGTYDLAQYLYKEYIAKFPKEKDAYIMTFYYGELLFKLGSLGNNQKYCEAAPVYTQVVHMDTKTSAKYLKEAAYAAVISWKNCLSIEDSAEDAAKARSDKRAEKKTATATKGKGGEPVSDEVAFAKKEISPNNKKMIDAFDEYIKYVPDAPELVTIKYRKARIYYEANHFEEAAPLFAEIAENHKQNELAVYSANLLIDCLNIRKDYVGIGQYVDKFLATQEFQKDQDFMKQLGLIKAQLERKKIEQLEHEKKYCDAARLYIKITEEHPDDPKLDELYFNAGSLFEKCHLLGAAIQSREALIKTKPDSPLAKKAIFLVGRNYQDIAAFEQAAKSYEDFASKYPGEKEAPVANTSAIFFQRGLGNYDKDIDDTKLFTKNFGGRKEFVDQAAGVNFSDYLIYEQKHDNDGLQHHLQVYLREWGGKGGIDRQIIAHVKIAEILWRESCTAPNGGVNGACIEIIRARAGGKARVEEQKKKGKKVAKKPGADIPKQCGPETKSKVVMHDRKPALAKEAQAHFAEALKLWKAGAAIKGVSGKDEGERDARIADMTYYAAEARMVEGDTEYEKFLRMNMPEKLDFTPAQPEMGAGRAKAQTAKVEASKKALKDYIVNKDKKLTEVQKIYQSVILFKNANWAIAAAARIGQLFQDFSGQLYTAPVPKAPAGIDEQLFHDAYCDQMVDLAEPIEGKALQGLTACLSKSTDLSWFNEWSQLCEGELNQIKPNEYPLAAEIRAQPGYSAVTSDRADVQSLELQ